MLNKTRAMEVVDRVGRLITKTLRTGGPAQLMQKETDRLADAIVSIEYYMETVKAGRAEPWYMLDNAEACLSVLRDVESRLDKMVVEEVPQASTMKMESADIEAAIAEKGMTEGMQQTEVLPLPVVAANAEHLDPELLEIFIEEAREEIASIKRRLPTWADAPDDMEALITVRRSFHTLKGSGRMVGAERIGEFCWSVENLLNRLINRTLQCTPPMIEFIMVAAAAVPELVEQLEVGSEPVADINLLMAREIQRRKPLGVGRFEGQLPDLAEIQLGDRCGHPVGPGQGMGYGRTHVRLTKLRQDRAIDIGHHGVDDRLRVNQDLDL